MNTFYENRRDALLNTLTEMEMCYRTFPGEPQLPTLSATTQRLKEFAADILHFFNAGFTSGKMTWAEYPPNNVYSILLDQIAFDIEVIRRAADQRITTGFTVMKQRLKEADKLAWQVLQPLVGEDKPLEAGTTVVTYFQKSPLSRVIPYANVALIGIPFTCVDEPRDLLATPHEVGHYVYWHARNAVPPAKGVAYYFCWNLMNEAVDRLKTLIVPGRRDFDNWCLLWLEELFADVYGSWAAGPVSTLTLQDNQANRSKDEFAKTDGEHPAPLLRPYSGWKVLANRAVDGGILDLLKDHWQHEVLGTYGGLTSFDLKDGSNVTVNEAVLADSVPDDRKPVDLLVKLLIQRLSGFGVPSGDWRHPLAAPTAANDLYTQYQSYRTNNLSKAPVVSQPEAELSGPLNFKQWATDRFDNSPDLNSLIQDPDYPVASPIPEEDWLPIMLARGWTTEGPNDRWP
jgi:hypothetical protein